MKSLKQISGELDYAYALLNQKEVLHTSEKTLVRPKKVTSEDVAEVKTILAGMIKEINNLIG